MLIFTLLASILLTSDNYRIDYQHYKNNHDKVIIIAHGFYNSKDAVVLKELAQVLSNTYDVVTFDFRGHGRSSGLFSWTSKEEKDLTAVLDYVKGNYKEIGLIGFSLGAAVSINLVSKLKDVTSLVAISAPSDVNKIDYHLWKLDWKGDVFYTLLGEGKIGKGIRPGPFWLKKDKPIDSVSTVKIPILYIHGDKDWVIKPWHSQALYEKTNSKTHLEIIKNGAHSEYLIRDYPDKMLNLIKGWFDDTL